MLSYAKIIIEDPVRRGLLYAGTENAIYVSFDAGDQWQPLQNDLPSAPVSGIVVQEHFNDLVISTYGRGFWILDDITPLRTVTPAALAAEAHLFPVRDAYRFRPITAPSTTYDDPTTGENPRYGASINYHLKAPVTGGVRATILDEKGAVVRTITGTNVAGVNRIYWDLRHEPSMEVRLLTSPLFADHIVPGPTGRVAPGTARLSVLATPGRYTVRLKAGSVEQSQPLLVKKDPNSAGTDAEIAEQVRMAMSIQRDLNEAADAVHRVESARVQLSSIIRAVEDSTVRRAAERLAQQFVDLEMNLVDLRQTGTGQDGVRFGSKLIAKMNYLANGLSSGDDKPTNQHGEVQGILNTELKSHLTALDRLLNTDLNAFNELLKQRGVPNVTVRPRGPVF